MSPTTRVRLAVPSGFDFAGTARSHGWVALAPNAWHPEREMVERVQRLSSDGVVRLAIAAGEEPGAGVSVTVHHRGGLSAAGREQVAGCASRMLRLDEDLSEFHDLCAERGGPWAAVTRGLGRLLRSPTLFEDVVKTILTTNVQWGGTKRMVRELVEGFGEPLPPGAEAAPEGRSPFAGAPGGPPARAFPTPEAIAAVPADAFADAVGLGYRAPYVHELARRVATDELDLEALALSELPTAELEKELRGIEGVGPYAAATLLMLIGRYDLLAVDSVFREFVGRKYFDGARATEAELRAVYEPWGRWKYLAYWFDLLHE